MALLLQSPDLKLITAPNAALNRSLSSVGAFPICFAKEMTIVDHSRVGFIGLGNMGVGMAHNLAVKGFALTVFDVREEPLARLRSEGATVVATCADVGSRSDILCIAVFDDKQIEQVIFGNGSDSGALGSMPHGGLIILHPTTEPAVVAKVAAAAAEKDIAVVDAPMTGGGGAGAEAGSLIFMVGGKEEDVERARPVLDAMAATVFHVGLLGAGQAAKIVNNFLGVSNTILLREALRLAESAGIAEEQILEIVNFGNIAAGASWCSQNWGRIRQQEATYTTGRQGMVAMATKDMKLAHRLAQAGQVATPTLDALVAVSLPDLARSGLTDNGID